MSRLERLRLLPNLRLPFSKGGDTFFRFGGRRLCLFVREVQSLASFPEVLVDLLKGRLSLSDLRGKTLELLRSPFWPTATAVAWTSRWSRASSLDLRLAAVTPDLVASAWRFASRRSNSARCRSNPSRADLTASVSRFNSFDWDSRSARCFSRESAF